jgi:DNA ligase 1
MEHRLETLYARDSKQKILQWNVAVVNNGNQVDISIAHGEYNGAQALSWRRNIKGKNIGKSNETTPFEQAMATITSMWHRKIDKGYKGISHLEGKEHLLSPPDKLAFLEANLPLTRTDASGNIKPMKAQQYYRSKKDWTAPDGTVWDDRKYYYMQNPYVEKESKSIIIKFPCVAQPKINGVRATISLVEGKPAILSKEGKSYNIPHLLDYLSQNLAIFTYEGHEIVLDGELYIHGEPLAEISSAVKKVSLVTQRVKFIIFDLAVLDLDQMERWGLLKKMLAEMTVALDTPVELIRTFRINNDEMAQKATDKFIDEGYEGAIFRSMDAPYQFGKRPMTMVKLKRTISDEFKIIDIRPQTVDTSKGNFVCLTKDGAEFEVNPKGTDDYKRQVLKFKRTLIGKDITLVFYEWTPDNKPYHVIDMTIRDYE